MKTVCPFCGETDNTKYIMWRINMGDTFNIKDI